MMPQNVEKTLKTFYTCTKCPVLGITPEMQVKYNFSSCAFSCDACGNCDNCIYTHRRATFHAQKFGGKYIYACPMGFLFCMAQAPLENGDFYILAGPINSGQHEDNTVQNSNFDIPYLETNEVSELSELLAICAGHISGSTYKKIINSREKTLQQQEIGDYIQSIKSRLMLGVDAFEPYPYEKEKQLTYAIITGNIKEARKYLNEILGHIFFASAANLDAIKIRAMELTVLISRAALDGGADMNHIYQLNLTFISDFFRLDNIEDVCFALTELLNKFMQESVPFESVKHAELLSRVVSFVRENYMHKITLEDTAQHVFLSPSYLSKIFKEEMSCSFNHFLNSVRIEKCKILLLSEQLSLLEICELVGFSDQSYFNKVFKKATGLTPKKYREQSGIDQKQKNNLI